MDLAQGFDDVVRIVKDSNDAASAWTSLVGYLESRIGDRIPQLANIDVREDVGEVRRQLEDLLKAEPPPGDLNAFYFGLFDGLSDNGAEAIGYYIAGVKGYDSRDDDTLRNPAWWPEGRHLGSVTLDAIKESELFAGTSQHPDRRAFLGYAGQLGAALIVSRFASAGLFPGRHRLVGFASGDFVEIVD